MADDIQSETLNAHQPLTPTSEPNNKRPVRRSWWNGALAAVVLSVVGTSVVALTNGTSSDGNTTILTHTVTRGDLSVSVTEQGTVASSHNEEIKCKAKGASTVLWVIETGTVVAPGDVVVRLDTSQVEESINQQKIAYENALANRATAESDVEVAQIAITEYLEATFPSALATAKMELAIAQSNLNSRRDSYLHAQRMFRKGYVTSLAVSAKKDAVTHTELEVEVKKQAVEGLEQFTKQKTVRELEGVLEVAEARLASYDAALKLEESRLKTEQQQLENCVIRAESAGMVIYPQVAEWKEVPDIEQGAMVRQDQVLLMIPDLTRMQVEVAVHESKVDRLQVGMHAQVVILDSVLDGQVSSVASVARPTGWWTNNMVTYDVVIDLDQSRPGLKPGMTCAAEIFLADYKDVLTIPVAAVLEQGQRYFCWVETEAGMERRRLTLTDSDDRFAIVEEGVQEGERVVLNPLDFLDDAQKNELRGYREADSEKEAATAGDESPATPTNESATPADKTQDAGGKQEAAPKQNSPKGKGTKPTKLKDQADKT